MRQHHSNISKILQTNQGFTLIEILIALVLMALILGISISNPFSQRDELDKNTNQIERAIRFMADEAALKNAVIRLHLFLDKNPQEFAIEYGPSSSFILPPKQDFETTVETKEEEIKRIKEQKDLNLKFNKISEFQENNSELTGDVKIIGIGTSQSTKLQTKGEASIYTFPTGEKDEAIVILTNEEDIISIKTNPFSNKIEKEIVPVGKISNQDLQTVLEKKAKEIFEKWQKEK